MGNVHQRITELISESWLVIEEGFFLNKATVHA